MVKRLWLLLDARIRGVHEAAYVVAAFALLSQILALLRDRAFAHAFGASAILDAYFAAFKVPDLLFAIITVTVSSAALVPLLSKLDHAQQGRYLSSVLFFFGVLAVPVSIALYIVIPTLLPYMLPGFNALLLESTTALSRIMLLQPILLGVSSIVASIVQFERRFVLFALAPLFYNGGIILGVLILYPLFGLTGLAWGVVIGALLHLCIQVVPILNRVPFTVPGVGLVEMFLAVVVPSVPRALALFSNQGVMIMFAFLASRAGAGALSAVTFAQNLHAVPLAVIGVSYAAALFPALAELRTSDREKIARELWASVRHVLLWMLVAATFLIVLRAQFVRVILGSGEFSWDDTRLTAALLALFAASLAPQAILLLFSRAYYALERGSVAIVVNVSAAIGSIIVSLAGVYLFRSEVLVRYFVESLFKISDVPNAEVIMLAAGYAVSMWVALLVFAWYVWRDIGPDKELVRSIGNTFAAAVIGSAGAYLGLQLLSGVDQNTFLGIFIQGFGAGVLGMIVAISILVLLRSQELRDIVSIFNARLRIGAITDDVHVD
ncbi:MAG: lipid II flippase MurJ [Patescibacteria group bacterium]